MALNGRIVLARLGPLLMGLAWLAGCDSSVLPAPAPEPVAAWRLVNPRDFPVSIAAVWGVNSARMLAVGAHGAVMVKEGDTWRSGPRPTAAGFYDVHGCDWNHAYAVAGDGVYRFDGRHWARVLERSFDSGDRVWSRAPDDVMVVNLDGTSFHYDGSDWQRRTLGGRGPYRGGHWLTATADGYLAVCREGVAVWRDGRWSVREPQTWWEANFNAVCRVDGDDDDDGERYLAVGAFDTVFAGSPDGSWEDLARLDSSVLDVVAAPGRRRAYVLGERFEGMVVSTETGDPVGTIAGPRLRGLWAAAAGASGDGTYVCTAGDWGRIFGGTMPAGSFGQETGGVAYAPNEMLVQADGTLFAFDQTGALVVGRGDRYERDTPALETRIRDLAVAGPDLLYATDNHGDLLRLVPGISCTTMPPPPIPARVLWCAAPDDIWIGGNESLWRGDGTTWHEATTDSVATIQRILGLGPDDVYIFERRRILHWDGSAVAVVHQGSYVGYRAAVVDPRGDGVWCPVEALEGGSALYPILKHFGAAGVRSVAPMPGRSGTAAFLSPDVLLAETSRGLFRLDGGAWTPVSHPAVDQGGAVAFIAGNPTGGIYSVSDIGVIHYLDTGGTGLWQ